MDNIEYIVIHCSATPPSRDIGAAEIDRWHRARGWLKIGYHRVINRSGEVEEGRDFSEPGAHAYGYNTKSVGICLIGGVAECPESPTPKGWKWKPEDNFTDDQRYSLAEELWRLKELYPGAKIVGHNSLNKGKTCPSFDVDEYLEYMTIPN